MRGERHPDPLKQTDVPSLVEGVHGVIRGSGYEVGSGVSMGRRH